MEGSLAGRGARSALPRAALEELSTLLGDRLALGLAEREHHGRGESYHPTVPPDAVCYALGTEEVSRIVRICAAHRLAVIPFGGGTSLEGHVSALDGGVCIDLSRMTGIVAVRPQDLDATVQAGVTRHQLNDHLRDTGLFFPVDPGGESTLGGMAATRASGTNAVRYGTMKDNVVSLTAVMADGSVIRTSSRARKSSAGYDLTRLLVGSEGTLGIITELTVRLYGIPESVTASVCAFPSVEAAVATVVEIVQCGIPIARVELLDPRTVRAVNRYSGTTLAEQPTLFMEFHGSPAATAEQMRLVQDLAEANGVLAVESAADADRRNRLWRARHDVHYAIQAMRPNAKVWSTDVCVPISNLPRCIAETQADIEAASFFISTVGHVGDGNFHLGLIVDPTSAAELAEAEALNDRLVRRALALDGTCTGEHGVGSGKIKFMTLEHGPAIGVMQAIKRALDPEGILNPGKVLPGKVLPALEVDP
ncbi:FAD-binding oxidoreductase [Methylobacterium nodulans]|uniref:D-lactate dehydrogenase (cytochrome) n=1 Tax=Methylobacterium nodulans (strain LMG 21967 / CNCM I-2342 / ORS 2060) TaxID=460265 RepID=B8INC4_METNO|nr:FAD-linked oxidase C-terminal domain-containing protein [Methylobacterium nodulans]ACL56450.1 FAD linked oxidase domain protein [Methylobacterium nodulans ORS 2060]